jgi:uncharacterized membrane protein YhaH (DUF805 family)
LNRHNRRQFALLGLPAIINTLILLVVAFQVSFRVNSGYRWLIPFFTALVCLCIGCRFAVKRGHDIGWTAWSTIGMLVVGTVLGPALLLPACLLLFLPATPSAHRFGPPPDEHIRFVWLQALVLAGAPWLLMLLTRVI